MQNNYSCHVPLIPLGDRPIPGTDSNFGPETRSLIKKELSSARFETLYGERYMAGIDNYNFSGLNRSRSEQRNIFHIYSSFSVGVNCIVWQMKSKKYVYYEVSEGSGNYRKLSIKILGLITTITIITNSYQLLDKGSKVQFTSDSHDAGNLIIHSGVDYIYLPADHSIQIQKYISIIQYPLSLSSTNF